MAKKLEKMEKIWRKEKEEANEAFQQDRKVHSIDLYNISAYLINIFHSSSGKWHNFIKIHFLEIWRANRHPSEKGNGAKHDDVYV